MCFAGFDPNEVVQEIEECEYVRFGCTNQIHEREHAILVSETFVLRVRETR